MRAGHVCVSKCAYDTPRVEKPTRVPFGSFTPFENAVLAVVKYSGLTRTCQLVQPRRGLEQSYR